MNNHLAGFNKSNRNNTNNNPINNRSKANSSYNVSLEGRTFELSEKEEDLIDGFNQNSNKKEKDNKNNGNNSMNRDEEEGNNNNNIKRMKSMQMNRLESQIKRLTNDLSGKTKEKKEG